jgi:hypothetical protein
MFDAASRYQKLDTATLAVQGDSGQVQVHVYKRRRFLPKMADQQTLLEHRLGEEDRLDNLAAQYIGDPTQAWRICDANLILNPMELAGPPGRPVRIAMLKL